MSLVYKFIKYVLILVKFNKINKTLSYGGIGGHLTGL